MFILVSTPFGFVTGELEVIPSWTFDFFVQTKNIWCVDLLQSGPIFDTKNLKSTAATYLMMFSIVQ